MKQITRRELFREMVSKDTLKQVMTAWYGFSEPLSEKKPLHPKKTGNLLQTIKKIDMKNPKHIRKEG